MDGELKQMLTEIRCMMAIYGYDATTKEQAVKDSREEVIIRFLQR